MTEGTLRAQLVAKAQALSFDRIMTERAALRREAARLTHALNEAERRISFWDRANVFSTTPNEARAKEARAGLAALRPRLVQLQEEANQLEETLGREFPLFALGAAFSSAVEMAAALDDLGQRAGVLGALDRAVEQLLRAFVPEGLGDALAPPTEEECQATPVPAELQADAAMRYAPISREELSRRVAARLLAGDFFRKQAALEALVASEEQAFSRFEAARDAVSIWDKLLFFHTSRHEEQREQEQQHAEAASQRLREAQEEVQFALQEALGEFPPLRVYLRALTLRALVASLAPAQDPALDPSGALLAREVLVPRPLVLAVAQQLEDAWREVFPDMPLPTDFAPAPVPEEDAHTALRHESARRLAKHAATARERAIRHAALVGGLSQGKEEPSWIDRFLFGRGASTKERQHEERLRWNRAAAARAWEELRATAQSEQAGLLPVRIRDSVTAAVAAVRAITTDSGSGGRGQHCRVYGQAETLQSLSASLDALQEAYELLPLAALADAIVEAKPTPGLLAPDPLLGHRPLSPAQLASALAQALGETPFLARYGRAAALRRERAQHSAQQKEAEAKISVVDKLNIFTSTPAEQQRNESAQALSAATRELEENQTEALGLLRQALLAYPPPLLAESLQEALAAVRGIRATQTRHTSTDSEGREEVSYTCTLQGYERAVEAVTQTAVLVVRCYGDLPSTYELLSAWPAHEPRPEAERHPYRAS